MSFNRNVSKHVEKSNKGQGHFIVVPVPLHTNVTDLKQHLQ